jgi:hypothetical protein
MSDKMIVLDGTESVSMYQLLSNIHALALEINTGMGRRLSTVKWAQVVGLSKKRTKKGVLTDLITAFTKNFDADYTPGESVRRALQK